MNKSIILLLLGVFAFMVSCEKEGDKVMFLDNPKAPQLVNMPDLNMSRDKGGDVLVFETSAVNPGFTASATYALEAAAAGTEFATVIPILSTINSDEIEITVSDLNALLIKHFPEDATSSVDFRVRSRLSVDAGTGAPGTGNNPFEYISTTQNADVSLFGFLRLDLINSGMDQKITSPLSNGIYGGFVKLDPANAFTLLDPETSTSYGGVGGVLEVDGAGILVDEAGWYKLTVDNENMTYEVVRYLVGIVGEVNGWSAPDLVMDYNTEGGYWYHNDVVLPDGGMKFRHNEDWSNDFNLGVEDNSLDLDLENLALYNDGGSQDIPMVAGTYNIKLWLNLSDDHASRCSILPALP